MIEYFQSFYSLTTKLFYVLFFSFLYIPLFNKCNVKKKIKKNGKSKIISQPKSVLALTYLILLFILFKCFTFKMIVFIIISVIICSLILVDRLSTTLNESLYKFNKSSLMILCWKLLHTVFTILNMITNPLFSKINNKINTQISMVKNLITKVANLNISDNSSENFEKELLKISNEVSNMSDYICKSNNKFEKKEKVIELDNINEEIVSTIDTSEDNISECNTYSKTEMINKMTEINKAIDTANTENNEDEDMTLTITEVPN